MASRPVCQFSMSICSYASLSVRQFVCTTVCLSVHLSVCPSAYLYVCMSVRLFKRWTQFLHRFNGLERCTITAQYGRPSVRLYVHTYVRHEMHIIFI